MTPAEFQPNSDSADESAPSRTSDVRRKWVLTREALDKLLDQFSTDRDEAGRRYEVMTTKLCRFFEWRSCPDPESLADETINRVARRIDEGENIFNLNGYFSTVARLVFLESLREPQRVSVSLDEAPEIPAEPSFVDDQKEARLRCLDECLAKLTVDTRALILKYYHNQGRAKIDHRKQLATAMGIQLNALRIRAHRTRTVLEKCVEGCLARAA